jgi:hypothetical protein
MYLYTIDRLQFIHTHMHASPCSTVSMTFMSRGTALSDCIYTQTHTHEHSHVHSHTTTRTHCASAVWSHLPRVDDGLQVSPRLAQVAQVQVALAGAQVTLEEVGLQGQGGLAVSCDTEGGGGGGYRYMNVCG